MSRKSVGAPWFPLASLFGEFARAHLGPTYREFYRRVYNARLTAFEQPYLSWWRDIISDFAPRLARNRPARADWLIYTDAATDPTKLCALLIRGDCSRPSLDTLATARVDAPWIYLFRHTALIYGLELLALVAFFELQAPLLRCICRWIYLDNNNCRAALTRGDSNTEAVAILVARFWQIVQRFDICVLFSRARSKLNPADLPTRAKALPFKPRSIYPISSIRQIYHRRRSELRKIAPLPRLARLKPELIAFRRKEDKKPFDFP